MTTILKPINNTVNSTYGAIPPTIPPLTVGQVYTTNHTGSFLTSTGNGTSWTTGTTVPNETIRINQTNPPTIEVKGNMIINGRDLEDRLDTIEKVLQIPERDVTLEKKHPKLQEMYYDYINALAKYRMWEAIKGNDNGTT